MAGLAVALAACGGDAGPVAPGAPSVASIAIDPAQATLAPGATRQLAATARDTEAHPVAGVTISWGTADAAIATVSTGGLITAVAPGTVDISATGGGRTGHATIVVAPIAVATVAVEPAAVSLLVGEQRAVGAVARGAQGQVLTGRSIVWSSGNVGIVTVTANGTLTAVAPGSASILATVDGVQGAATITVLARPVATVAVTPPDAALAPGGTQQLTVVARDAVGTEIADRPVAWSSSNAAVATVSTTGLVTAVAAGAATITATVDDVAGTAGVTVTAPTINLTIDGVELTQSTQDVDGSIPMIEGRPTMVRVYVRANATSTLLPAVRLRLYRKGVLVDTRTASLTVAAPVTVDPTQLGASANFLLPASFSVLDLSLLADVDPTNAIPELSESDNAYPANGTPLVVVGGTVPPLAVVLMPIFAVADNLTGDVSAANADAYLEFVRRVYPVAAMSWSIHPTYTFTGTLTTNAGGLQLLSELNALRIVEGNTTSHYYGAFRYSGGPFGGYGTVFGRAAIGQDAFPYARQVLAHELGHNFVLQHAPCGAAGSPDPSFPYPGGVSGVPGYDVFRNLLRLPSRPDLMGYCNGGVPSDDYGTWTSDYGYRRAIYSRGFTTDPTVRAAAAPAPVDGLLVWGQILRDGTLDLQPVTPIVAPPTPLRTSGRSRLDGVDASGAVLFAFAFDGLDVPDENGGAPLARQFAFVVPLDAARRERLVAVRLTSGTRTLERRTTVVNGAALRAPLAIDAVHDGATTTITWDATATPLLVLRDPVTGQVLSLARGGRAVLRGRYAAIDATTSDGVRGERVRVDVH